MSSKSKRPAPQPQQQEEQPRSEDVTGMLLELRTMYGDQGIELAATRNRLKEAEKERDEALAALVAMTQTKSGSEEN